VAGLSLLYASEFSETLLNYRPIINSRSCNKMPCAKPVFYFALLVLWQLIACLPVHAEPAKFFETHCFECHSQDLQEGGLDLTSLKQDLSNTDNFARWLKIHDRIESGEMPPKKKERPPVAEVSAVVQSLRQSLMQAEQPRLDREGRTAVRRLTRAEYENTVRDLFEMSGIALQGGLPADGSAHGFDKNNDALDISHVNLAKYVEAADHALDLAIATSPKAPASVNQRISLATQYIVQVILMNGDAIMLKDQKPDPNFPPSGEQGHIDQGAHNRMGSFSEKSSVGVFRHEDESFNPYFQEFATLYPGRYRIRASFWSFGWDKGKVLPARGTEAARLSAVQLTENGRGGGHPSYVLGYYDAPSLTPKVHEFVTWLNLKETLGFNAASLAPVHNYNRKGRAMAFTGPGLSCDWLEVEGPLNDIWPPRSHRALFGDLPLVEFKAADHPGVRAPKRQPVRQEILGAKNQVEQLAGIWTVHSEQPLADADRLLATFLPRAFRRPVDPAVRQQYVTQVDARLKAGDCFESAMRWTYRAALCSPDFLYHVEGSAAIPATAVADSNPAGPKKSPPVDDYALAARLSYFFWNSMPDETLTKLAETNKLHDPEVLRGEVDRLLKDPKSQRFVEDFLGQWLRLRQIAANDPDRKLYPEFSPYLQDSMVGETRAYFRELLDQDLNASYLVRSDFAMLNEKLATHYGVPGVSGAAIQKVKLPPDCPRGSFLTQASILKITANGTTTSPVPRGAFVMARLLGEPPDPPPPNIPAIEPDVRGAKTIREQLDKHRADVSCASCHAKMDPPGFALEAFDVIGGLRTRYRSIGEGDPAPRGLIDPFIGIGFKLGPAVDASGVLLDERRFSGIAEFQAILAADSKRLLKNFAEQIAIYSTGRDIAFSDRDQISAIIERTQKKGGGVRTLIHEVVQSQLFQTK
jgi:mono/diheme cytochrome c family protein